MTKETDTFNCDLCNASDSAEIEEARTYTGGQPLHVCKSCGLVYAKERRSEEAIAESWTQTIFGANPTAAVPYTAHVPWMTARLVFVAEFLHQSIGLKGKAVADIGAGEGVFLDIIRREEYGAIPFGIEPSAENCALLTKLDIPSYNGPIGAFAASPEAKKRSFDVVTMMWTMECSRSPRQMLDIAYGLLKPGGHVFVGTGSRILVPFKKPLHMFLSKNPLDTHPVHFSYRTLRGIMATAGFEMAHVNRFIDNDLLFMIGKKTDRSRAISWDKDDWTKVKDFFARWHKETQDHYPAV